MSELIIGNGFFARNYEELVTDLGHDVYQAGRHPETFNKPGGHYVDMLDQASITAVLEEVQPDIIVNGAAILGRNNDRDLLHHNPIFASNLLNSVHNVGLSPRIVTMGSSSVYGPVNAENIPVHESASLNPSASDIYGRRKKEESEVSHRLADAYGLDVVEARLFNPLGPGMHGSNLITVVMNQVKKIQAGDQEPVISVRNTEVQRDYSHVKDLVHGIGELAHTPDLSHRVYNVGSGIASSNKVLIESVLHHTSMEHVGIQATDATSEPIVGAMQANIERLTGLGWKPEYTLDETIAEIVTEFGLSSEQSYAA